MNGPSGLHSSPASPHSGDAIGCAAAAAAAATTAAASASRSARSGRPVGIPLGFCTGAIAGTFSGAGRGARAGGERLPPLCVLPPRRARGLPTPRGPPAACKNPVSKREPSGGRRVNGQTNSTRQGSGLMPETPDPGMPNRKLISAEWQAPACARSPPAQHAQRHSHACGR